MSKESTKQELIALLINSPEIGDFNVANKRDPDKYAETMVDGAKVGAVVGAAIGVSKKGKKETIKALLLGIPIGAGAGALMEEAIYQGYLER
jgi:hypothetical protein